MRIVIRLVEPEEASALAELARETYTTAFGSSMDVRDLEHHLATALNDGYFRDSLGEDVFFAAIADDQMIGFVQFGAAPAFEAGAHEIRRLYVHASHQSQGIGLELMKAAFAHLSLMDAARVYLDVWEENRGALRFYERLGFALTGAYKVDPSLGSSAGRDLVMVRRP